MRQVRPAAPADVPQIVRLCGEHARYERAEHDGSGLAERLLEALFGPSPQLVAWVVDGEAGGLSGYATASVDFSTWSGRSYLHLDCLYLQEDARGRGHGRSLMQAVMDAAHDGGHREVQWQTPSWNVEAVRFYEHLGARGTAKIRFTDASMPADDTGSEVSGSICR
ncbi:MAG: GNAT family N-acetyltransferase [Steroidobacteraceae bacterium]